MQYIIKHNFLDEIWLDYVKSEVHKWEGRLSRFGYNDSPTLRDKLDPRNAETSYVESGNILTRLWHTKFWPELEQEFINTNDSGYIQALHTRAGKTLLSSYGDGDHYGFHIDIDLDCIITAVLMLTLSEEQMFTGGSLLLQRSPEQTVAIPFENNKLVIFPSCMRHGVSETCLEEDKFENRRFTLQHFISAVPTRTEFPDESNS